MGIDDFLGLHATEDAATWRFTVEEGRLSSSGRLFGGCALAAGIRAMELFTAQPCRWATAQFVSSVSAGAVADVAVQVLSSGSSLSQVRAIMETHELVALVSGAFGQRCFDRSGQWTIAPVVPGPEECPPWVVDDAVAGAVHRQLDLRLADGQQFSEMNGTAQTGRSALWARLPDGDWSSAAGLAILGDFAATAVSQATGVPLRGTSLDNTLRVFDLRPTKWVLLDMYVDALTFGVAHGRINLWGEDGVALGVASQSVAMQPRKSINGAERASSNRMSSRS